MRALPAAGAALAVALGGCGEREEPPLARGPTAEAAATVQALERAAARRDFGAICRRLLAAEARRRLGGDGCPLRLRHRAAGLRSPRVGVVHITLRGRRAASVRVRARAAGERPADETIELVRERGRFRIAALMD